MDLTLVPETLPVRRVRIAAVLAAAVAAVVIGTGIGGAVAYLRSLSRPEVQVAQTSATQTAGGYAIPAAAVSVEHGASVVYVVVNGVVVRQPVTTVPSHIPGTAIVTVGLSPHARVVLSPQGLSDGERVRVR